MISPGSKQVLTMLAQEGLTGRDFEGLTGKGGKS